jgi:hypothetical protein
LVQGLPSLQSGAGPPTQEPDAQVSPVVQAEPSSQLSPSGRVGLEQMPVAGSQTPASWQLSRAVQMTGSPPTQIPALQVSLRVQASRSSQIAPVFGVWTQPLPGSHESSVHGSPSSQPGPGPPLQTPAWQVSAVVHTEPSSQAVPSGLVGFEQWPVPGSQVPASWH